VISLAGNSEAFASAIGGLSSRASGPPPAWQWREERLGSRIDRMVALVEEALAARA
jgi:hypothetical protein